MSTSKTRQVSGRKATNETYSHAELHVINAKLWEGRERKWHARELMFRQLFERFCGSKRQQGVNESTNSCLSICQLLFATFCFPSLSPKQLT